MKKLFALTLAAATLTFTACGNTPTASETTTHSDPATTAIETTAPQTTITTEAATTYPPATVPVFTTDASAETTTSVILPVIPEGYSKNLVFISNGNGTCYLDRRGDCADDYITIPPVSPEGDRVTAISEGAFQNDKTLYGVDIPESVSHIGKGAFSSCEMLTEVRIANGISKIEADTFRGCLSLAKVTLPESLLEIGASAFKDCTSLASIGLPSGILTIGENAFENSGLKYITFPRALTKIGARAFYSCDALMQVQFSEGLYSLGTKAFYDCLVIGNVVLPSSLRDVGEDVFNFRNFSTFTNYEHAYYMASASNPYFLLLHSDSLGIETFNIHPDTQLIAENAFRGCYLPKNLTLPHSVRGIGANAFALCTNLENLTLGNNVEFIGRQAFLSCPIENLTVPVNVRIIEERAFEHSKMHNIVFHGGETLGDMAFAFSDMRSVTISAQAKNLPYGLFYESPYLNDILYLGTAEQWNAIEKADGWDEKMGGYEPSGARRTSYTVHCTDTKITVPIS